MDSINRRTILKSALGTTGISAIPTTAHGSEQDRIWIPAGEQVDRNTIDAVDSADRTPPWDREGWSERRERLEHDPDATEREERSEDDDDVQTSSEDRAWLGYTEYVHSREFDRIEAEWEVPANPPTTGDSFSLFTFPALQNCNSGWSCSPFILQPVLQWNYDGSGRWEIANWYGSNSDGYVRNYPLGVSAGDTIYGEIEQDGDDWLLGVWNLDSGSGRSLRYSDSEYSFTHVFMTLESVEYSCNWIPDSVYFDDIVLDDGSTVEPNWSAEFNDAQSGDPDSCEMSARYSTDTSPTYVIIDNYD